MTMQKAWCRYTRTCSKINNNNLSLQAKNSINVLREQVEHYRQAQENGLIIHTYTYVHVHIRTYTHMHIHFTYI